MWISAGDTKAFFVGLPSSPTDLEEDLTLILLFGLGIDFHLESGSVVHPCGASARL